MKQQHCRIPHAVARDGSLSTHAKAVLLALDSHADWHTGESFPSVDTLCIETGLSQPTVTKATRELVKRGLVGRPKRQTGRKALYILIHRLKKRQTSFAASDTKAANESTESGKPRLPKAPNVVCSNNRREQEELYDSPDEQVIELPESGWWDIIKSGRRRDDASSAQQ